MAKNSSASKRQSMEGIISINMRAVGYLTSDRFEEDIEIATNNLGTALHGDTVEVLLLPKAKDERPKGKVVKIRERVRETFVGVVEHENGVCYVRPDDRRMYVDILIPEEKAQKLTSNTKVLAKLTKWTDPERNPLGEILEALGQKGEHDVEMHAIVLEYGFKTKFPKEVEQEASSISKEISTDEIAKRRDCRGITTFTIDPVDAKDFDDALSLQKLQNGNIEIGIHIADVSHYVTQKSELEREARSRATSVYLVDRTIPMLPERLSNDICSLNPNEDRLAFSAIFTFDKKFNIIDRWYGETVIHSNKRFSYEEAQEILDDKKGLLYNELFLLNTISHRLRDERFKHGGIEFDQDEIGFDLDDKGKPIRVYKKLRQDTNKLIEEFMLLANREVAKHVYDICKSKGKNAAFVYRIHDAPNPEKIEELGVFLRAIGHELNTNAGTLEARDINKLFSDIEGKSYENLVKTATIRSMAKAVYSTKNIGHFGLAFKYYTHFTSPIRRYPDVMVHRILKSHLNGTMIGDEEFASYERLAIQSSAREVEAVQAERDSIKYKQVEYMSEHVGEDFEGVITGVTEWGIYVEETGSKAEGLVRISSIGDDYYVFDKKNYRITGEKTKQKFTLGDKVQVKLTETDLGAKTIDFVFVKK